MLKANETRDTTKPSKTTRRPKNESPNNRRKYHVLRKRSNRDLGTKRNPKFISDSSKKDFIDSSLTNSLISICFHCVSRLNRALDELGQSIQINLRKGVTLLHHRFVLTCEEPERMFGFIAEMLGHAAIIDEVEAVAIKQTVLNDLDRRIELGIALKGIESLV